MRPGYTGVAVLIVAAAGCGTNPSMKATLLRKATPMDSVVLVVSLVVARGLYAACLQVSSRMHRRTSISWAQAFASLSWWV